MSTHAAALSESIIDLNRAHESQFPGAFHAKWKPHGAARRTMAPLITGLDRMGKRIEVALVGLFRGNDSQKGNIYCAESIRGNWDDSERILRVCIE